MSRTANVFFSDLNRIFIEYLILQVCKVTDPAKDLRRNDNFTIAFLLRLYDFSGEPTTLRRLSELDEKVQAFRVKLLPARNKVISHSDRDAIMANRALGGAPEDEWNEFWLNLQDLVCIIHEKIVGEPLWINGFAMSNAHGLLKALRHSDCFDKLLTGDEPQSAESVLNLALS